MPDLAPRKLPRQGRSRATCAAILQACARILATRGYAALTTNHIAERAGVGIGTLYDFFPNRESIVLALAQERLARLTREVEAAVDAALALGEGHATEFLIRRIVDAVSADRELYRVLLREASFVLEQPGPRQALVRLFELGRVGGELARERIDLPDLEVDTWLIGRMVAHAVLDVAFHEAQEPSRERAIRELVRLTSRMLQGRDTEPAAAARALSGRAGGGAPRSRAGARSRARA
jgi:AcrR family transcriptional regulator